MKKVTNVSLLSNDTFEIQLEDGEKIVVDYGVIVECYYRHMYSDEKVTPIKTMMEIIDIHSRFENKRAHFYF